MSRQTRKRRYEKTLFGFEIETLSPKNKFKSSEQDVQQAEKQDLNTVIFEGPSNFKTTDSIEVKFEINSPKAKFKPFDEEAQHEEEQLSKILFGGEASFLQSLEEAELEAGPSCIDSGVGEDDSDEGEELKPAWYDEDDDGIEVGQALDAQGRTLPNGGINQRSGKYLNLLQNKFSTLMGTPSWASLKRRKSQDSDSDEDDILQTCGFLRKSAKTGLPSNLLEFKKVKNLNAETYNEGPYINSIEFHPNLSVALVAGNGGIASLYTVDGKRNNKLHNVTFERFPIFCSKFLNNGNEAILGSRHSHIFNYDLISAKAIRINLPPGITQFKNFIISPDSKFIACAGKWGEIHLLTSTTKERVAVLKQDASVTALSYNQLGNLLYSHSNTGEVTIFDMNMRRVRHKFIDEGCLQGSTIALSSSNQFLAAGSAQGVVNLYGVEDVLQNKLPKPRKTIMNLTTAVTDLKFNSTSEILALASGDIQNAVKLFHIGAGTIFNNFPPFTTKLGHLNVVNFSPNSGYLAFGNRKSTVALYRLKYFKNY